MLKKIWTHVGNGKPKPRVIENRYHFDMLPSAQYKRAVTVVNQLLNKGYEAYLVGGCVRDALLGFKAKDFDVSTNATPDQLCKIFTKAKIIGRRFKIVHVRSGPDLIEVTTFRAGHDKLDGKRDSVRKSQTGQLTRDNVFGTLADDAIRRDFSINSLYYDVDQRQIVDFCGGYDDALNGVLKVIGEPDVRFREDPVRMIRAIRFSVKLQLPIDRELAKSIKQNANLLSAVSPYRMFDEIIKLLMYGYGLKTYRQLAHYGMLEYLFAPTTEALIKSESSDLFYRLLEQGLINTDNRIRHKLPVTPAYLFAFLLWPAFQFRGQIANTTPKQAFHQVLDAQSKAVAIPNYFKQGIEEIWQLQDLLCHSENRSMIDKAYYHRRFRAAYDFLLLREQVGEKLDDRGAYWTAYQQQHPKPSAVNKKNSGRKSR